MTVQAYIGSHKGILDQRVYHPDNYWATFIIGIRLKIFNRFYWQEGIIISKNEIISKNSIDLQRKNRIKEVLKEKHLTQTWLSSELGKSYNMVNSYVQNRRQPSIELLYEIAGLLKMDPRDLLVIKNSEVKNK